MHEYYKRVHDEAWARMRQLVGQDVEDSCTDMKCGLEYVKRHGTSRQFAEAIDCYIDYKWAAHEIAAHEMLKQM